MDMGRNMFLELVKEDQETDLLLAEARELFHEAVDNYPVEEKADMWTSRVRAWLEKAK
jgi:hypothetical protein